MKKFLALLLMLTTFALASHSQVALTKSKSTLGATDTATATTSAIVSFYESVVLDVKIVKGGGTLAGTIDFQASVDGTNWVTVQSGTITNTATAQMYRYKDTPASSKYYRAYILTTGGTSTALSGYFLLKGRR